MQKPLPPHKPEIIHQSAIRAHRLRPHSRPTRRHIFHPHLRHQSLARPHKLPLPQRPPKLRQPIFPVLPRHRAKSSIHKYFHRLAQIEIAPPISLAPERQHRIRPRVHIPLNPPREVHSQKRIPRIRHGINQAPPQLLPRRVQIVILPAKWNQHHPRIIPRHARHPIAIQPRAIHHIPRRKISRSRSHHHFIPRNIESHNSSARLNFRPARRRDLRILRRHRRIIRDRAPPHEELPPPAPRRAPRILRRPPHITRSRSTALGALLLRQHAVRYRASPRAPAAANP